MNTRAATPNFDRVARPYRWLEYLSFGDGLQRCRTYYLPQLAGARHALVLGDGDGRFTARLLATNRELRVVAVDTSAAMLELLRRQCGAVIGNDTARLCTVREDASYHVPSASTDLVVAHFFFDCLTQGELDSLIKRMAARIQPQAVWLASDFRIPEGAMRGPALVIVRALYVAFGLLTGLRTKSLPDHGAGLRAAGLTCIAQRYSLGGLLTTELWRRTEYTSGMLLPQRPHLGKARGVDDPLPDPEPASPSLPGPDPGVFHREPGSPAPPAPDPGD